jgi:hypothetical protein
LHALSTAFVLGFHGCDKAIGERLLNGEEFRPSANAYDWLGPGVYFWEANPRRGLEFAKEIAARGRKRDGIREPFVVGAVLDLGLCLDLATASGAAIVREAYDSFAESMTERGAALPTNSSDLLRRNLDCAVLTWLHTIRDAAGEQPVETVKGIFVEGDPLFPGSGFREKTHIQICVRNPARIKGVFRVHPRDLT